MTIADTEYDSLMKEIRMHTLAVTSLAINGLAANMEPSELVALMDICEKETVKVIMSRYEAKISQHITPCMN